MEKMLKIFFGPSLVGRSTAVLVYKYVLLAYFVLAFLYGALFFYNGVKEPSIVLLGAFLCHSLEVILWRLGYEKMSKYMFVTVLGVVTTYFFITIPSIVGIGTFFVVQIGLAYLISENDEKKLSLYSFLISLLGFYVGVINPQERFVINELINQVLIYSIYPVTFLTIFLIIRFYKNDNDRAVNDLTRLNSDLVASEEELKMQQEELFALNNQLDDQNLELLREHDIAELTQEMGQIGYWEVEIPSMESRFTRVVSELFGVPHGQTPSVEEGMEYYPEEVRAEVAQAFELAMKEHEGYDLIIPFLKEKKEKIWVRTIGRVIVRDGEVTKVYGTFQDVTEQKNKEDLLRQNEVLEKSVNFKSEFLAQMSHEIRTPMNGMVGLLDVLAQSNNLNDEEKDHLKTIQQSSSDLISIISDVLNLSKLEAGKEEVFESKFDPKDILSSSALLFKEKGDQKSVRIVVNAASLPDVIQTDKVKIGQVVRNFVSNAVKFSKDGGTIEINASVDNNNLRIEVADNGVGIRQLEVEKLFTKFYQTSNSVINKFEGTNMGTGIGLQISKQIIDLLGGQIGVDSEFGKGSTFWFEIPVEIVAKEEIKADKSKQSPGKFNLNVLVVEDKLVNQKVAEVMLKSMGCSVDLANNGEEGVMAVQSDPEKYDLILMDIQMPVMDGITATAEIRKMLGDECPAIVALSAKGMEGDKEFITKNGLDDYLSKPVRLEQLKEMFVKVVGA